MSWVYRERHQVTAMLIKVIIHLPHVVAIRGTYLGTNRSQGRAAKPKAESHEVPGTANINCREIGDPLMGWLSMPGHCRLPTHHKVFAGCSVYHFRAQY